MKDIIIIGAGAAGTMAAYAAARQGAEVLLIERNKTIGRKLAITGGGRCNLTNQTDINELVANIPGNGRFLFSSLQRLDSDAVMRLFEAEWGVPLKVERGRRVFPLSDKAQDIIGALSRGLKETGVTLLSETRVVKLLYNSDRSVAGVVCSKGQEYGCRKVIVATGGASYPGTGSSGDGYKLAEAAGHRVTPLFPALVPLETQESWVSRLEGLSLVNIRVSCYRGDKLLQTEFGELLFTGFGLSGPVILSVSRAVAPLVMREPGSVSVRIDLKPALDEAELDRRLQRDFAKFVRKNFKNALDELLPSKLIPVFIDLSGIDPVRPVHQITREERLGLVNLLKDFRLTITRPRPLAEAIVTAGGVSVKEIDPKTMESKLHPGLYFAGEVMDVDGYTGGYNLQIAFSTGHAAGTAAALSLQADRPLLEPARFKPVFPAPENERLPAGLRVKRNF